MSRKSYHAEYYQRSKGAKRHVRLTLTPEEHAAYQELADSMDLSVAQIMKRLSAGALKNERFVDAETKQELSELSFLVRNISNNLNQLARHSNRVKSIADENGVFDLLRELDDSVKRFVSGKDS